MDRRTYRPSMRGEGLKTKPKQTATSLPASSARRLSDPRQFAGWAAPIGVLIRPRRPHSREAHRAIRRPHPSIRVVHPATIEDGPTARVTYPQRKKFWSRCVEIDAAHGRRTKGHVKNSAQRNPSSGLPDERLSTQIRRIIGCGVFRAVIERPVAVRQIVRAAPAGRRLSRERGPCPRRTAAGCVL